MNCRNFLRHFSAYLDKELEGRALAESRSHVEGCERCSRRVAAYRQGIEQLHRLPNIEPPVDLALRVRRASFSSSRSISFKPRRIRFLIPAAAAVVIALVLAVTFIRTADQGKFAYEISPLDSTMDVVNLQLAGGEASWRFRPGADRPARSVWLVSYIPGGDEPAFSYPVHTRAVFVRSGVSGAGE